jgi:anti-sigma28 factor (negative regulator of flagellin synthesis)
MAEKLKAIKEAIKNGTYNLEEAIESAASKIVENPEVLLWR